MKSNSVFNATVCLLGVLILLIHVINLLIKKNKRNDEKSLLVFFLFTMVHFSTYFTFTMIKESYTSDTFIMAFYTTFYIMNNLEVLLFYFYMKSYAKVPKNKKLIPDIINIVVFVSYIGLDIFNIFSHIFFKSVDGVYTREKLMILSQGYQFIMLAISFLLVLPNKTITPPEKASFIIYCILPAISIIIQNAIPGYAIAYLTLLIAIEILFLFLNVEKNIKIQEAEKQLKDANVKIMVSQIQPHFIYNTLSSISTLIPMNPSKAQRALDQFTDYLRMNFSTLTNNKLVTFDEELKHIKTYVDLEKMRFNERVKVNYDIQVTNFHVPPLSIQPLVENAIKHGILKKIEGGTVTLKTYSEKNANIVEIIDDGVGFDIKEIDFESNKHIGFANVKHRIATMTNATLELHSEVNKGTKVVVKFYK